MPRIQLSSGVVAPLFLGNVVSANNGVLSLGGGPWDGSSAGHFVGSAGGTILAINAPGGYGGNLIDAQVAGSSLFYVTSGGQIRSQYLARTDSISSFINLDTTGILFRNFGTAPAQAMTIWQNGGGGDTARWGDATPTTAGGIRADGLVYATGAGTAALRGGLATWVKAGTPVDTDWSTAPPSGTIVGDSTGSKLWIRLGSTWKSVTVA